MPVIILLVAIFFYSCTSHAVKVPAKEFYKPITKIDSVSVPASLAQLAKRELCTSITMAHDAAGQGYFMLPSHNRKFIYTMALNANAAIDSVVLGDSILSTFNAYYYSNASHLLYTFDPEERVVNVFSVSGKDVSHIETLKYPPVADENLFFVLENFKVSPGDKSLVLNYLLWKNGSKSYTGSTGLVVENATVPGKRILAYPERFRKERVYSNYLLFDIDTAGNFAFTYESYDSVFIADKNGYIIKRGILHNQPVHPVFNAKKEPDLAYVRKYQSLAEKNIAIKVIGSKIVTIKKLPNPDFIAPAKYKYFVHNMDLKMLYADTFNFPVSHGFFGGLQDSFVVLNSKLTKAYIFSLQ